MAVLGTVDGSTRARGAHSSLTGESPDYWTRSQMGWVASGGRKFNFLEDFGTKRISDSGYAKCPQGPDL